MSVITLKVVMLSDFVITVAAPPDWPFWVPARNTNRRGRLSTVDLLIKVACFVTNVNNIITTKIRRPELVSTRRSTVLRIPFQ